MRVDAAGKPHYVDMGVLDLRKEKDAYTKLQAIYECISEVCKSYHPTELAIESPFYGKNAQVVLKLGRAQGAAMIAALEYGVESVTEYAPRKVDPKHLDATDALAIAMCHFYQMTSPLVGKGSGGSWEKFIAANPDRVK